MKKLLMAVLLMASTSAFSATLTEVVDALNAVISNESFVEKAGSTSIKDLKVVKTGSTTTFMGNEIHPSFSITVNAHAPLADGCSIKTDTTSKLELFAAGPAATGGRTVVTASDAVYDCGPSRN